GHWLKQEGEWVEKDEDLVEIETEKATVQLPAPEAGQVTRIFKKAGDFAEVGEVIAELSAMTSGSQAAEPVADAPKAKPAPAAQDKQEKATHVMPAAERLLAENGLRAEQVKATGPGGRLLKEDVLRHLEQTQQAEAESVEVKPAASRPTSP